MAAGKEEKKKEDIEVINAVYRVNLHCMECGNKIKKHLLITPGVQSVDIDIEKDEIKAKGKIDPLKILKLIEKKSKKKVELISPKVKPKETPTVDIKPKEIKDPIIRTISVKVHMHCDKCEADLKSILIKHKGIFNVKTDQKAQTVTVEGTIEVDKLISFLRKRVHKNAEIISIKEEKKGKEEGKSSENTKDKDQGKSSESTKEKNDDKKSGESTKKKDDDIKSGESTKKKDDDIKSGESTKKKDDSKSGESTKEKDLVKSGESAKEKDLGKSGESAKGKAEGKLGETSKIIEIHQGYTKEEIKIKDNVPYIIHYVYAPQLFSDENPNSCSIL
ncbi:heavy metal-associated isoprenylated plant protein 4 [Abrus precatorius]|uniref:Heavy metal-associated isoprenylated plant protein 4 n=1 Tax=Abrus precatorius TaxID=3816 RepID=A0A8B8K054_ABRPR|nr:heavy metal-associated isoprenylated plant protein 4 [Abrus precatorius]